VRFGHGIIDTLVLIAIMLVLSIGTYAIWDNYQVLGGADATNYAIYRPTFGEEGGSESFEELRAINPNVFAWLTVFGTGIDYPVVQGRNNMEYVTRTVHRTFAMSGSIFLDSDSCRSFTHSSSIFYGHHMERDAMFGAIGNFTNREFFDARRYGILYFDGQQRGLEFFAFVHTHAADRRVFTTNIIGRDAQQAYLDLLLDMAMHVRYDVPVTVDDRIVLLSTCSTRSTNGRDLLIGRITYEVMDDPFYIEATQREFAFPLIMSGLPNLWEQAPVWMRVGIIALANLLVIITLLFIYRKLAKKSAERADTQNSPQN